MTVQLPTFTKGDRLAKIREDAGVKRQEWAEQLGVSLGTISNWEHDRNPPPRSALYLYAELREDISRELLVAWIETGDDSLGDQPETDSLWDSFYGSQALRLFDPDEGLVIDLRDNRHATYTRRDSDDTYALTG